MADSLLRSQISSPCSTTALLSPFSINCSSSSSSSSASASGVSGRPRRLGVSVSFSSVRLRHSQFTRLKVHAQEVAPESQNREPKWWERNAGPNMIDIHSTQEFLDALKDAGDRLVIVEFYGTWCASCKALFPKLCRLAREHPDILFLKVNFDENKPMCKRLNVRVLPYFHFYRGADGQLESFSCSLVKFQKIKDAVATHNTDRCSIGPPVGVGNLNLLETPSPQEKPAEPSSI